MVESLAPRLGKQEEKALLDRWPLPAPTDWVKLVNRPQTEAEVAAVRESIRRGAPFGSHTWQARTAKRLGLEWTLRPRGRPAKGSK